MQETRQGETHLKAYHNDKQNAENEGQNARLGLCVITIISIKYLCCRFLQKGICFLEIKLIMFSIHFIH